MDSRVPRAVGEVEVNGAGDLVVPAGDEHGVAGSGRVQGFLVVVYSDGTWSVAARAAGSVNAD